MRNSPAARAAPPKIDADLPFTGEPKIGVDLESRSSPA
jgi:hypothetical protein